ncbi:MAG: glycosyltransferase family 4 protein [Rhodobacteraceae bacterium]|nr:glycosyltransferase family 4 protein [Paracoccaceae bacterium]
MHVAIDATSWENERGFGRFTRSLVAALALRDSGIRYTLLFDRAPERPVPANVDVVVAGAQQTMSEASSGKGARGGADMLTLGRAARRIDSDVFFFPAVYSFYPVLSRVPKVVCFHDTIPERFPDLIFPSRLNFRLWQAKIWLAKTMARRIMTVSNASAGDLTDILGIRPDRIDLTTEGAEDTFSPIIDKTRLAAIRDQFGIAPKDRVLTYIGGFNRHKNVLRLIEAMPAIVAACPEARLVIVGRTTGNRFWDNIDELKAGASRDARLSDRITFAGEIPDADMAGLLNCSAALVFPSLWEGFGLPALEAMSCGTPVLSSDRGSLPEIVGPGGLYYDPLSTEDLAARTVELLGDDALHKRLSDAALAQSRTFTWDKGAAMAEASFRKAAKT